ncbi:MAG: TspO/MBR family protein [archaeon]|jgi:tryptophan-rich sensory protein
MDKKKAITLVGFVLLCEIVGAIGSIFTVPNISTWYYALIKPFFSPPNWLFGPVWTILFLLMGVGLYLVWETKQKKYSKQRKTAINWFIVQFGFNLLWSYLFFGLRNPTFGFIGVLFLWVSIAITISKFYKVNPKAAYLLVPYILWVSFATILNYSIMVLN